MAFIILQSGELFNRHDCNKSHTYTLSAEKCIIGQIFGTYITTIHR